MITLRVEEPGQLSGESRVLFRDRYYSVNPEQVCGIIHDYMEQRKAAEKGAAAAGMQEQKRGVEA